MFAVQARDFDFPIRRVSQGREGRDGREGRVGEDDRDGSDGRDAASSRSSGWGRILAGILLGSNGIGAVAGGELETDAAGGPYILAILCPRVMPILCPKVGRSSGLGCTSSSSSRLSHGREASHGSGGREGAGGRVGNCNHLGRAFGSKLNAIKLIPLFLFSLVASGLRILQDFCRNRFERRKVLRITFGNRYYIHESAVSNPCPTIVPLASVAVFWLPPESRK